MGEAFPLVVPRWPKVQAELFDLDSYRFHVITANRGETAGGVGSHPDFGGNVKKSALDMAARRATIVVQEEY